MSLLLRFITLHLCMQTKHTRVSAQAPVGSLHLLSCPSLAPSLPPSLPPSLISDTLLDVSGLWFQYSTRFPILSSALPQSDRNTGKRPDGLNRTQDGDDSIVNNQENPTVTVCVSVFRLHRTVYSVAYRQVSRATPPSHFYPECCPGWQRFHSHNCNQGNLQERRNTSFSFNALAESLMKQMDSTVARRLLA